MVRKVVDWVRGECGFGNPRGSEALTLRVLPCDPRGGQPDKAMVAGGAMIKVAQP